MSFKKFSCVTQVEQSFEDGKGCTQKVDGLTLIEYSAYEQAVDKYCALTTKYAELAQKYFDVVDKQTVLRE